MPSGYHGDVNPEEGGFWWRMDAPDSDYADIVRIVPASDMGGPANLFFIEQGSLYLPGDKRERDALSYCGWIDESQPVSPLDRVNAMLSYWGLDSRSESIVQIGRDDPFYGATGGFGMPPKEDIMHLGHRTKIGPYVSANFVRWM